MPEMYVTFGRINRRPKREHQEMFDESRFAEDVARLARSRQTHYVQPATRGGPPSREWIAADLTITANEDYLTGQIGYLENRRDQEFDYESYSWSKGAVTPRTTGNERTLAAFAINLDPDARWVAFLTPTKSVTLFRAGLEHCLQAAALAEGMLAADWEVDIVTSRATVDRWLADHPEVFTLVRKVRFPNPGRELTDDLAEMRRLGARRKTEQFSAYPRQVLHADREEFREQLEGVGEGNLDVEIHARRHDGKKGEHVFKSTDQPDRRTIDAPLSDEGRAEAVLRELRTYRGSSAAPGRAAD